MLDSVPETLIILVSGSADGDLLLQLAELLGESVVLAVEALGLRLDRLLVLLLAVQIAGELLDAFAQLVELQNSDFVLSFDWVLVRFECLGMVMRWGL